MKKLTIICGLLALALISCATVKNPENPNSELLGDLFSERNAGFSMYIPKGWQALDYNQKFLMITGPVDNKFTPNIGFADEQYSGNLAVYIDLVLVHLSDMYTDLQVSQREAFTTNSGLRGEHVTIIFKFNNIEVRQKMFVLPNKKQDMVIAITCTAEAAHGDKYDKLFNETVKTFYWTK
jgi:hypothetical protein